MATVVMLKNLQTGLVRRGFVGFSWTMFFWGGFVPLFRGDILMSLLVFLVQIPTCGFGTIIWTFFYNRSYTTKLIEQGYQLADDEHRMMIAREKLGMAVGATKA